MRFLVNSMRWLLLLLLSPLFASAEVLITEVMCNPANGAEWVKVTNQSDTETIDVSSYQLYDNSFKPLSVSKGTFILAPQTSAIVLDDSATDTIAALSGNVYVVSSTGFNNSGEEIGFGTEYVTYGGQSTKGELCVIESRRSTASAGVQDTASATTSISIITQYRTVEIQPPEDVYVRIPETLTTVEGGVVRFTAELYDATGKSVDGQCMVTFGDGTADNSCAVLHAYKHVGSYMIQVTAHRGALSDKAQSEVTVLEPALTVALTDGNKAVTVTNDTEYTLELNGWGLRVGYERFDIPDGTLIPKKGSATFDTALIPVHLAAYGNVVELLDSLNHVVARSDDVHESSERAALESATSTEDAITAVGTTIPENALDTPLNRRTPAPQGSILGTPVESTPPTATIPAPDPTTQLAAAVSAEVPYAPVDLWSMGSLLPERALSWLIGLLALVGLAAAPLFLRSAVSTPLDVEGVAGDDEAMQFTIQELR